MTKAAEEAIRTEINESGLVDSLGVRLGMAPEGVSTNGRGPMIEVRFVERGEPEDELVEGPSGLQMFVSSDLAPMLDDRVLDTREGEAGRSALVLRREARND